MNSRFKNFLKLMFYSLLPYKFAISRNYLGTLGYKMNWVSPKDINEKINWLKVYGNTSQWSALADKYHVRKYIKDKGLSDILVRLYGKYDTPKDINFDSLPSSFVLKTNHGSGDCIVVKDKTKINVKEITETLEKAISTKYGLFSGERHYLSIKPCIIAEELLDNNELGFTTSLVDYKIWCFGGKPYSVWACYSRTKNETFVNVYDLDWNCHPEYSVFNSHYKDGQCRVPKPQCLQEMLNAASILSEGFPELRVDFYEVKGKLYFGELTFTSNGGYMDFYTKDYLKELGAQIDLHKE